MGLNPVISLVGPLAKRVGQLVGRFAYRQYFESDDGQAALGAFNDAPTPPWTQLSFVLPQDHLESTGALEATFNRRGYTLTGEISRSARSGQRRE